MTAECRVEALPLSGADICIDGLRLRLDIRIVPRSKEAAATGDTDALFRVVTAKLSRVPVMPAYQWAAVMFGVGVLLVAVTLWIAGPREAPILPEHRATAAPATPAPKTRIEPPRREAAAPQSSAPVPALATAAESRGPVPVAVPAPAPALTPSAAPPPRVQSVDVNAAQPSKRPEPPKKVAAPTRRALAAATAPAENAALQPVAQRPAARSDMLDLFGDTK
jgi:hypothetical protein